MQRVVALVTLSRADHPRVAAFARALVERGDRVVVFCPPPAGVVPAAGIKMVTLGKALSSPPRLREVLRFAASLGARAGFMHLRRRFSTVILHGGEEALALVGAFPRLTGARLVLDMDPHAHDAPAGVLAAMAGLARKPALRLVDDVMAADDLALQRVASERPDVARVSVDAPSCEVARREKQPRLTVKTPVRVATRLTHLDETRLSQLHDVLAAAVETDERVTLVVEGLPPHEADHAAKTWGLSVESAPARGSTGWADAMSEVHVALAYDEAEPDLVPYLALGVPVLTVGAEGRFAKDGVVAHEDEESPEAWAATLSRLTRSSRERRDLIRKGWSWVEEHGWEAQSRRLYAVVDGEEAA